MSETANKRFMVTSALPYANGPIHIGHVAGVYLPADIFVRYMRLQREDVLHICGSDEHGVPIMLRARSEDVDPQVVVDRYNQMMADAFEGLGVSFDFYGRTTSEMHAETSQAFFADLAEKNVFQVETQEQLFDPEAGLFLADRFVRGTCPKCEYDDAYGDQCERCGQTLSPRELLNPRSAITNATPELRKTAHWYLPLDEVQPWLEEWIASKDHWKPNVRGQVKSWLQEGLAKRAMTRDLPWGVPVPKAAAEQEGVDASGKVMYVWFDAPLGYISMTREWAKEQGDPDAWTRYWKDDNSRLIHFIGKDNIVFHCVIFPAMLHLKGDYVLPDNVPGNEFLNLRGMKTSTSRGVAVWLHEFLEKYPADYLRYGLTKVMPETRDSDFSWEGLQAAINNELADTLGNFVNRAFSFAKKHFDGTVPSLLNPSELDTETLDALAGFPIRVGQMLANYRFRDALDEAMSLARLGNKYFNDSQPWATRKTDPQQCANTIHVSLQIMASLSILFDPFLPFSMSQLRAMLELEGLVDSAKKGGDGTLIWDDAGRTLLESGHQLGAAGILFTKLTNEQVEAETASLVSRSQPEETSGDEEVDFDPLAETIAFDDFAKIDLRIGTVLDAEAVPKSKKLIRTQVDLGFETRQILAGVAQHMEPEDLVGKTVVVVANLAPRKIFGFESQGMLLMAEDRTGRLVPIRADSESGSVVR
ncbi:MAG: methionine--tRNA ligase [Myxococcota bacterium]|nr:methionine--tRNA ligase [Myxococcota bacterium]